MRRGSAAASFSSAAAVAPDSSAALGDDPDLGKHAPARLAKGLKTAMQERELTEAEQAAFRVAKAEWNRERAVGRQRKRG